MRAVRRWAMFAWLAGWVMVGVPLTRWEVMAADEPGTPTRSPGQMATVAMSPTAQMPTVPPARRQLPDGALIHIVRSDDTLFLIALEYGVTVEQLLQLNYLRSGDFLRVGQELIVQGPPPLTPTLARPTPATPYSATPSRISATPQPTVSVGTPSPASLCVLAFNDRNGNGLYDGSEELVAQVSFSVMMGDALAVAYVTNGMDEPKCLTGLTPGVYTVQTVLPENKLPSMPGQAGVALAAGQTASVAFGVRSPTPEPPGRANSSLSFWKRYSSGITGITGVIVLIAIAGLVALAIIRHK